MKLIQSTDIKSAKNSIGTAVRKDKNRATAERGDVREAAGFRKDGQSFITLAQHEKLMAAILQAFADNQDAKVLEYIEYRLSVKGGMIAYRRLWEYRLGVLMRPIYFCFVWARERLKKTFREEKEALATIVEDSKL